MAARKEMYRQDSENQYELSTTVIQELLNDGVPVTDDTHKHNYRNGYHDHLIFPDQPASLVALIVDCDYMNYVSSDLLKGRILHIYYSCGSLFNFPRYLHWV